jgi:uncharacterized protein
MKIIENTIGGWVVRFRWLIVVITILYVAIPASGLRHLYIDSEFRNFIGESLPSVIDMKYIESIFNRQDNVFLAIAPNDGDVFSKKNIATVYELTNLAWQLPYARRVDSITNYQYTHADGDDLFVADLVEEVDGLSRRNLDKIKAIALSEPRLRNNLVSDSGKVTGINIIFDIPADNSTDAINELVTQTRELLDTFRQSHKDTDFYLNGTIVQDRTVAELIQKDANTLVPIVMVLMSIILYLTIGNLLAVVATLGIVGISIICAYGWGGHFNIHITPPVASAPTIIMTIAIANCVHFLVNFIQSMQEGQEKNEAIKESLRINLQPVSLASITTTFGFLTLNMAETPPFRDLGNLVSIGVMHALVLSLVVLPACLTFIPVKARKRAEQRDALMMALGEFIIKYQNRLLMVTGVFVVVAIFFAFQNVFNDNPLKYFNKSVPYRTSTDFINENLTGLTPLEFYLNAGGEGKINDPEFLAEVEAFSRYLESEPMVVHVSTFSDTIKRLNKNMHGDDAEYYRVPKDQNLAAQYLLLYEMSLPYGLDLSNELNLDKSAIRVVATLETPDDQGFKHMQKRALEWIDDNAPNIAEARASSLYFAYSQVSVRSSKNLIFGTFLALSLISGLLMFAFRSFYVGIVSFIANLSPAIAGFGIWGLIVGEIGAGTSIVAAVTIGIVVDDTVHVFSKYLRARREKGLEPEAAVKYALLTVGRALMITTVVLICGFLVLLFSDFRLNFEMGVLTSIVLFCALGAVFFLAPPLMIKFKNRI